MEGTRKTPLADIRWIEDGENRQEIEDALTEVESYHWLGRAEQLYAEIAARNFAQPDEPASGSPETDGQGVETSSENPEADAQPSEPTNVTTQKEEESDEGWHALHLHDVAKPALDKLRGERRAIAKTLEDLKSKIAYYSWSLNQLVLKVETQPAFKMPGIRERSIQLLRALDNDRSDLTALNFDLPPGKLSQITEAASAFENTLAVYSELEKARQQKLERRRQEQERIRQLEQERFRREEEEQARQHALQSKITKIHEFWDPQVEHFERKLNEATQRLERALKTGAPRDELARLHGHVRLLDHTLGCKRGKRDEHLMRAATIKHRPPCCRVCGERNVTRIQDCCNFSVHGYGKQRDSTGRPDDKLRRPRE